MQANQSMDFLSGPAFRAERRITALVVDDSRAQRLLLTSNLRKWGFEVLEAEDGRAALDLCLHRHVDIVLSDWVMPNMNGLEFCEAFRSMHRRDYGYFILLTSKSDKGDVAEGLDRGADDFLSKPVNTSELRARLQAGVRLLDMQDQLRKQNRQTEQALERVRLLYESINKDLIEAEKLQHSLIPVREREVLNGHVSLHLKSSGHVGGDMAGFFRFSDERIGIYSIDVSGHGVSSALLTARLAGYLSSHNKAQNIAFERQKDGSFRHQTPDQVAFLLNERMLSEIDTDLYFTLAFADVCLKTGHVAMVQAGHPPPVVFNAAGEVTFHGKGGLPVGLLPDIRYEKIEFTLKPGDRLMLYTDGFTECENPIGQQLGESGLAHFLKKHADNRGLELMSDLIWELTAFAESDNLGDDISGIMLEFDPSGRF